jgi:hypothetical protein
MPQNSRDLLITGGPLHLDSCSRILAPLRRGSLFLPGSHANALEARRSIGARGKDDASRASLASFAARTCACAAGYCVSFARALAACGDVIESMAARGNLVRYWPLLLCFALPQVVVLLWIWLVR